MKGLMLLVQKSDTQCVWRRTEFSLQHALPILICHLVSHTGPCCTATLTMSSAHCKPLTAREALPPCPSQGSPFPDVQDTTQRPPSPCLLIIVFVSQQCKLGDVGTQYSDQYVLSRQQVTKWTLLTVLRAAFCQFKISLSCSPSIKRQATVFSPFISINFIVISPNIQRVIPSFSENTAVS